MTNSDGRDSLAAREKLIVALDVSTLDEAGAIVASLAGSASFYKIGLELVYNGGLALAKRLVGDGKKVFLDLKLHDIPTTVERTATQLSRLGATFLTVHAFPQTMQAARKGVGESGLGILGVTVMTSYDDEDLTAAGYALGVRELVAKRAEQAVEAGIDGLILSAAEVETVRRQVGAKLRLVTPGIRPIGAKKSDQKRIMTPAAALAAGADYLVIGRPITRAADPRHAAESILAEMAQV